MNKSGMVDAACERTGLARRQVEEVLESALEAAAAALARGEPLILLGYLRVQPPAGRGTARAKVGPRWGGTPSA